MFMSEHHFLLGVSVPAASYVNPEMWVKHYWEPEKIQQEKVRYNDVQIFVTLSPECYLPRYDLVIYCQTSLNRSSVILAPSKLLYVYKVVKTNMLKTTVISLWYIVTTCFLPYRFTIFIETSCTTNCILFLALNVFHTKAYQSKHKTLFRSHGLEHRSFFKSHMCLIPWRFKYFVIV